jgi:hypothetical protein
MNTSVPRIVATSAKVGVVLAAGAASGLLAANYYTTSVSPEQVNTTVDESAATANQPDPDRLDGPLTVYRYHDDDEHDDDHYDDDDHESGATLKPAPQGVQPPSSTSSGPQAQSGQS